jgi:MoaA/NifB/PqqE/SkfB family radical SAM enzyme
MGQNVAEYDQIDDTALTKEGLNVRDLAIYLHTVCNLRCDHCYIGNEWLNQGWSFEKSEAAALLDHFSRDGLDRLTFIGGEPTLYPHLTDLIKQTQQYDIAERRITTNGVTLKYFDEGRLDPDDLDHVSFSFEGHTAELHEDIRGEGTFDPAVENLKHLQERGFETNINYTVTSKNIGSIEQAIAFFGDLGVGEINFHLISMVRNAADNPELAVSPADWLRVRRKLETCSPPEGTELRIPKMFVTPDEYEQSDYRPFQEGSYHTDGQRGHRIIMYPNGKVYMSADLTGTDYNFAVYEDGAFELSSAPNELSVLERDETITDPSAHLLDKQTDGLIPVSVSYKEIIE